MSEKHKILGDKAPENPWEEMIMLREKIWEMDKKVEAYKERMEATGKECSKLAGALKCASETCSPDAKKLAEQILREASWIP